MRFLNLTLALAGLMAAGCHSSRSEPVASSSPSQHNSTRTHEMKNATEKSLNVSKTNNAGRLEEIGVIHFNESNRATLSVEGSSPEAEQLKKDWEEISKQKELTWKQARPGTVNGESVTRIVGERAKPGDDNYIYAVLNTLERKYGYSVDLVE
jgi:hypothetical protein